MVERIINANTLFAIIIRNTFSCEGIEFFTPNTFSQQLAYMKREKGYIISPHLHNPVLRKVYNTQEVLYVKSGKVRVNFFNDKKEFITSAIIEKGDVILLAAGGHGFEMIEESEMIEVKQGPYCGDLDKIRFNY